jgi:hypothetical protein
MNRISYKGVPMWTNAAGELYFFEVGSTAAAVKLGTVEGGLASDWKEQMAEYLTSFRAALPKRLRKPEKNEKDSRKSTR